MASAAQGCFDLRTDFACHLFRRGYIVGTIDDQHMFLPDKRREIPGTQLALQDTGNGVVHPSLVMLPVFAEMSFEFFQIDHLQLAGEPLVCRATGRTISGAMSALHFLRRAGDRGIVGLHFVGIGHSYSPCLPRESPLSFCNGVLHRMI